MKSAREPDFVEVIGAREHNLAIDRLAIPKRQLVVFTGPCGSGKSSLAFDTLYAEGQRRYVETLSAYARQFLGQLERPKVEHLRGLSPTIAIEQKSASSNPRSTVGTITEIYDYLRVLYAKVGEQRCPACGKKVAAQGAQAVTREVLALPEGTKIALVAPARRPPQGRVPRALRRPAGARLRARRGRRQACTLDAVPALDKKKKHDVDLVVDRVVVRAADRARVAEGVEAGLREGKGELRVKIHGAPPSGATARRARAAGRRSRSSRRRASRSTRRSACARRATGSASATRSTRSSSCPTASCRSGRAPSPPGPAAMARGEGWTARIVDGVARAFKVDLDMPWSKLPEAKQNLVLYGANGAAHRRPLGQGGDRQPRHVGHEVRGRHPEPRATLPRDGVGGDARAVPAVPARAALRRLRRQAPARREPRGARLRQEHRRRDRDDRRRGLGARRGPVARPLGASDRRGRAARDRGPPALPARRRPRLPHARARRADA